MSGHVEDFAKLKYPDMSWFKGYGEVYFNSVRLDGCYEPDELRKLADFLDRVHTDFDNWYAEIRKIDAEINPEPVNVFWHDFCNGLTPQESYNDHKHYGW